MPVDVEPKAHVNVYNVPVWASSLCLLSILWLFIRPQNELPFLATIAVPLLVSLLSTFAWLLSGIREGWTKISILMIVFLILGAIFSPIATNQARAVGGGRTLFQLFFCYLFPMVALLSTRKTLKSLVRVALLVSIYLGIYSITHAGRGPGDFMGDENDMCLVLIMFAPLSIAGVIEGMSGYRKFWLWLSTLLVLSGIVVTESRGGFLGLFAIVVYFALRSKRKMKFIGVSLFVGTIALLAVPQSYWREMSTITDTSESTAENRMELWKIAHKVFSSSYKNSLIGVGFKNIPVHMGDFESSKGKNYWGRSVHSTYFELLTETGVVGVLVFLAILVLCYRTYRNIERECSPLIVRLKKKVDTASSDAFAMSNPYGTRILGLVGDLRFILVVSHAVMASLLGVFVSAAFISTLFYPPIWFLFSFVSTLEIACYRTVRECRIVLSE